MKIIILSIAVFLLLLVPILVDNALAATTNPDSVVIHQVNAYRNVIEENDQFYLIVYEITYSGTTPTLRTDDTFICRLHASDGSQIGNSTTPYPYNNDGYSYGMISLYFSSDDVTDLGMNWGAATGYYISLEGNPLITWASGQPVVNKLNFANWFDETTVNASQEEITLRMRYLMTTIESEWNIDLIEGPSGESYLTYYGEEYATHAIENLRAVCPDIFKAYVDVPEFDEKDYTSDLFVGGDDKAFQVYGNNFYSQSFTMTKDYNIQALKFKGYYSGTMPAIAIDLYEATIGGTPTGSSLAGIIAQPDNITTYTDGEWVDVVFDTLNYGYTGERYCIVFSGTSGDANNYLAIRADESNGYDGGLASLSTNAGTTWAYIDNGTDDIMFSIISTTNFDRTFQKRMEDRLIGTPFDMTNTADDMGMSRLWFSSLLYIILSFGACYYVAKRSSPRYVVLTFLLLQPIGGLLGLVGWQYAIVCSGFIPAMLIVNNFAFRRT